MGLDFNLMEKGRKNMFKVVSFLFPKVCFMN